jgi:hypothetical protein
MEETEREGVRRMDLSCGVWAIDTPPGRIEEELKSADQAKGAALPVLSSASSGPSGAGLASPGSSYANWGTCRFWGALPGCWEG